MNKSNMAVLCLVAFLSTSLLAGPVQDKQVSVAAKWVVHVDVEGAVASGLGQYLIQKGKDKDLAAKTATFKEKFGFDPLVDLQGVTLYGEDFDPAGGVAIIQAKVDQATLLKRLAENTGHKELKYGARVVHQWTQEASGRMPAGDRFGTFYSDDITVIAQTQAVLQHAVDVLDGKADNLTKAKSSLLPQSPKGTFFVASAVEIALPNNAASRRPMLQNISSGSAVAGEDDNGLFYKGQMTAKTAEDAANVQQVIEGFMGLALLSERAGVADVPAPDPSALLKGVKASAQDKLVTLEASASLQDVQTFIDSAIKFREAMKAAHKASARTKKSGK
jgi:hypothetical protein